MATILPKLLAFITRHPRYIPNIVWSDKSWTHNMFRVWEFVFGRKVGIRKEGFAWKDRKLGKTYQVSFTWENRLAVLEGSLRELFKFKLGFKFVPIPEYAYAGFGVPQMPRIFRFAIAKDADAAGSHAINQGQNWNHTCTGSDLILFALINVYQGSNPTVSVTYNSASLTSAVNDTVGTLSDSVTILYKYAPSTGTNSVAMSFTGGTNRWNDPFSISYSGAQQSGNLSTYSASSKTSSTTNSFSITPPASNNGWVVVIGACSNCLTMSAGTGLSLVRRVGTDTRYGLFDSNGAVSGGSAYSMSITVDSVGGDQQIAAAVWFDVAATATSNSNLLLLGVG
jgi:hypothetical protein